MRKVFRGPAPPSLTRFLLCRLLGSFCVCVCPQRLYINCPRMAATFPAEFTLSSLDGVLLDGDTISVTRKPLSPQA